MWPHVNSSAGLVSGIARNCSSVQSVTIAISLPPSADFSLSSTLLHPPAFHAAVSLGLGVIRVWAKPVASAGAGACRVVAQRAVALPGQATSAPGQQATTRPKNNPSKGQTALKRQSDGRASFTDCANPPQSHRC